MGTLAAAAAKHAADIVRLALRHDDARKALVVFDARTPLSRLIAGAYKEALPAAAHLDFDATDQAGVLAAIGTLSPGDLVVLIQSMNFRLSEFRFRIEL